MARQYTKDKTARLSFRVNETLYGWVSARAEKLGVSPCDYARSVLFQQMAVEQTLREIDSPVTPKPVAEIARAGKCAHRSTSRR